MRRRTRIAAFFAFSLTACDLVAGPEDDKPPAAPPAGESDVVAEARFQPGTDTAVLTFAGDRGSFKDGKNVDDVPADSRGLVKVSLLDGPAPPDGYVWAANFRSPESDGSFVLKPVPRDLYEELALGQGLSSKVEVPEGLEPPEQVATVAGQVIVYKTAWCGVCKQVEAYLKRKGVDYVAKDIEKDREAAAELQAKAAKAGKQMGSVPMIDVGGELLVGFDRDRLEKLLPSG